MPTEKLSLDDRRRAAYFGALEERDGVIDSRYHDISIQEIKLLDYRIARAYLRWQHPRVPLSWLWEHRGSIGVGIIFGRHLERAINIRATQYEMEHAK